MSNTLNKLWDSLSPAVPDEPTEAPQKGALESLWDNLSSGFKKPSSQSLSKQRSNEGEGDGINIKGKSLQGSRNGLHGQLTLDTVFTSLIDAESGGKHLDDKGKLIKSRVGAEGITQLMPSTAKKPGFGIEPVKDKSEDEYKRVGKEYLKALYTKFEGDWEKTLAAYNWGLGNVTKAVGKAERFGGEWKEALPDETKGYLNKILKPKPDYGNRSDGTKKGRGFLGELKRPDGNISTEISIGVNIGGREMEIPTLVPGLTQQEQDSLLKGERPSEAIVKKAVAHAKERIKSGKNVFAD